MQRIKEFFKKYKKPILIILAIILILLIILFSIPLKTEEKKVETSPIRGKELAEQPTIKKGELTQKEKTISSISVVAKNFTEIYGSFSNQSYYINIENSLDLLSKKFKAEMSSFLDSARATYVPATEYEGVTTIVLNTSVESIDEENGKAVLILKTQRKESKGVQANYTIKYQDIRLNMTKEEGYWLIDSARWLQ